MLGDIVRYNFFALEDVDKDTYTLDYAVVLDINEENDTIKILPISNKFHKDSIESFCIGEIPGFVEIKNEGYVHNKQYVHFSKILNVPESELYPVHVQDLCGNITRKEDGSPLNVALEDEQLERILRKYKIYEIGEEKSLINLLMKSEVGFVLSDEVDVDEIKKISSKGMDKYREYNFNDKKIIVFFVEGKRYSIKMVMTENNSVEERNKKLKEILIAC
ncbi:hypothetical protein [Peptostreptococcus canis]|uniref:Uncharacterized protein n=1 Tax=Peptostreptococcus canis TaxID=1159213 RepID=A0ABR6TKM2_9FIRM|nr:hypothetical protein [Peptostreptococcus canis]MBC2575952.1 hypothetical protein [Peptostreptococcus canis]MBP1997926.1 hypothetical protein [Peptostreptococcus canis]